jgi:DNA-binding GntR family transcriptional regulator
MLISSPAAGPLGDTPAATSLTMQAVDRIDELLNNGRLVPGQRLIETDLCDWLGFGRVPVREALRILAGDGVIELVPGRGARVRRMGPVEIVEMLKVIVGLLFVALDDFPGAVDNADVARALIQARTQIEEAIVSSDYYRINEALCDYQVLLIELSGNGYLQRSMKKVHFTYYTRQVISYVDVAVTKNVAEPYPAITEALLADNVGLAKEIFLQARDRIIQPLTHLFRPG